jgi:hypothetical protein
MTQIRVITTGLSLVLLGSLTACGKDDIRATCDEPEPYQAVVPGKHIVVPEGLDSLDEFKEMSIPKSETPPRPEGARCIESPPSIRSSG